MSEETMTLEEARKTRRNFRILAGVSFFMLTVGSIFMHYTEKLSWVDSYYFAVVSLATVGYGDIVPKTDAGKIFVSFYILIGIGILAAFASNLIRSAVARRVIRRSEGIINK